MERVDGCAVTAKDHRRLSSTIAHGAFLGLMMFLTFAIGVFAGASLAVLAQHFTVEA